MSVTINFDTHFINPELFMTALMIAFSAYFKTTSVSKLNLRQLLLPILTTINIIHNISSQNLDIF